MYLNKGAYSMVYESMSLLELRKAAKEKNLKGISSLKKQELIEYSPL